MLYLYLLFEGNARKYRAFEDAGICQNLFIVNQKKYMSCKDNSSKSVLNTAFY